MSTWGALRKRYLTSTGEIALAEQLAWYHLTQGYRRVCGRLEVPELQEPNAVVTVADEADYFDFDCDVFAIRSIFNSTDGLSMQREEGGIAGRQRFLETSAAGTPKPSLGVPTHWVRSGNRVWVRDAADGEKKLVVHYEKMAPEVDAANVDESPLTPAQYDQAIVLSAALSFYTENPRLNVAQEGQPLPTQVLREGIEAVFGMEKEPVAIEQKAERGRIRLAGYRYTPRSARKARR